MATNLVRPKPVVGDLLSSYYKDRQVWVDFASAVEDVFFQNIETPTRQIEELRFLKENTDEAVLVETCRLMGFDLTQDILNLSVSRFTSIVNQLPLYNDYNGRDEFTKFLGLILGSPCHIIPLYTQDYDKFESKPQGLMLYEGGNWYKSTHVDFVVKRDNLMYVELSAGQTLLSRAIEIFYDQAPITLVIHRLIFYTDLYADLVMGAKIGETYKRFYALGSFPYSIETTPISERAAIGRTIRKHTLRTSEH
jgi:hypothetical protein